MASNNMCPKCRNWMMFPNSHRCPPKFEVINADDTDNWEWAREIFARDAETAAEKFADETDCEGDYTIIRGAEATILVRDDEGKVTRWTVTGESVPSYTAYAAEEPHP